MDRPAANQRTPLGLKIFMWSVAAITLCLLGSILYLLASLG